MRPKDIETIEDLIDHNFTVYASGSSFDLIKEMEFTKRARIVIDDRESSFDNLIHGSNRAQVFGLLTIFDFANTENYKALDETIITDQFGFRFPLNHFMFDEIDDKIVRLFETGIIQHFVGRTPSTTPNDTGPTVLQLDHLLIWFIFWLALLLITTFMFFGEVLVRKVFKFRKKKASKRKVKRKVKT
jgi:hypothetical protein